MDFGPEDLELAAAVFAALRKLGVCLEKLRRDEKNGRDPESRKSVGLVESWCYHWSCCSAV